MESQQRELLNSLCDKTHELENEIIKIKEQIQPILLKIQNQILNFFNHFTMIKDPLWFSSHESKLITFNLSSYINKKYPKLDFSIYLGTRDFNDTHPEEGVVGFIAIEHLDNHDKKTIIDTAIDEIFELLKLNKDNLKHTSWGKSEYLWTDEYIIKDTLQFFNFN